MNPKTAQTDAQILDLLKERRSPRVFADKSIESDKVRSVFAAAEFVHQGVWQHSGDF